MSARDHLVDVGLQRVEHRDVRGVELAELAYDDLALILHDDDQVDDADDPLLDQVKHLGKDLAFEPVARELQRDQIDGLDTSLEHSFPGRMCRPPTAHSGDPSWDRRQRMKPLAPYYSIIAGIKRSIVHSRK